jgi:hypothetical protein
MIMQKKKKKKKKMKRGETGRHGQRERERQRERTMGFIQIAFSLRSIAFNIISIRTKSDILISRNAH